ncbi:helix-turn-helix domain-containing protein [Lysobacter niastensis]|uniref:CRP-like protein Clp n=1 Tax=Lysobacter niastensis TaxID=380629 RepID=A0ABS0BAZ6_9GAMM|nr:helix-turn-helix domain-containing protein [Lysobacter niastensis]MBF6024837.1 helix-turn-helix domain-containing protein [Lysobacter niastensis]
MLDALDSSFSALEPALLEELAPPVPAGLLPMEARFGSLPVQRRRLNARRYLFRAGQPRHALYLVHAGFFKTCLLSEDGREKITGFRMRGDLLGLEALDLPNYTCDAISLDVGEVWEIPCSLLRAGPSDVTEAITAALAGEIRRDWHWMLMVGTLAADQRVAAFLLDLSTRLESLGFSSRHLLLRMTRGDLANYLALKLETVVRSLARLQGMGLIRVDRREIRIEDRCGLQRLVTRAHAVH